MKPLATLVSLPRAVPALAAACALFSGGLALAQPTITGVYPDGSVQFQPTNKLTFVAAAPAGVTNISVQLNGTKMTGAAFLSVYTSAAGLTINGNNVSAPLVSNVVYTAAITVTDATGASTNASVAFDTITPAYTFEAEDWDYDSGQFIDNPQVNAYAGLIGVSGVDANNASGGGTAYRTNDLGNLGNEVTGDTPRAQYKSSGKNDYDAGWNNAGNWANYTRHFPAGKWNLFMRGSNPGAAQTDNAAVSGAVTGQFGIPDTGNWQTYTWVPLTDGAGNLIEWDTDGSQQTVTVSTVGGSYNANFYMLLPLPPPVAASDATLQSFYPDGTFQFQATNTFSFTITSTLGVKAADITVQLGATNLAGTGASTLLQAGSGLSVTGPANNLLVTTPLTSNMVYTAFIQVTDANGVQTSTTLVFDTIIPFYTWEAEDWDYNGGQFFDNPQVDSYDGLDGVSGIDYADVIPPGGNNAYTRVPSCTETTGDVPRHDHADDGYADYDVGWDDTGNWLDYTRTWPAGAYNVYIRIANGGGATADSASLYLVTSGAGTANQVVSKLGTYASPVQKGWQSYYWQPIRDAGGNVVRFTGGSQQTLRLQWDAGNANVNFFLLMPVDPNARPVPFVSNLSPDGSAMFQPATALSFTVNSAPGISTNNILVTLNGLKATHLTFNGTPNTWSVTCPVATNEVYTVVITLTDSYGTSTYTTLYGNFPSSYYTFEAEDWDYSGGQFYDNPQVDAYAGLSGIEGVDAHNTSTGSQTYRPYAGGLCTETCGDQKRAQYVSASANDYDVAYTAAGFWANYTRTYPAGVYNVYLRASSPNANGQTDAARLLWVTSGVGTSNQTTSPIGTFNVPATGGWQNYSWAPLVDAHGNPVKVTTTGSASTFQFYEDNGGFNANFLMLAPVDTARPVISQLYPDGSAMFQPTNTLRFVASSSVGIDSNSVTVTLNGVVATDLVFSGSPTNLTVICPNLQPGTAYTATISVNTLVVNDPISMTYGFSTFSSSYYTFEAEDWDYNGGKFFDNPQTNAYAGLYGIPYVDAYNASGGGTAYRTNDLGNLGNEVASDLVRAQYASPGTNDYDVGWTASGNWANYTRTYPAGMYYVYARGSSPNGQADGASLSWVTSGLGTTNQTTTPLGIFNFPLTGGWETYTWTPLVNTNGNLITITTSGAVSTLRMHEDNGGFNLNFFMLVPATVGPKLSASHSGGNIIITWTPVVGQLYASPALAGPNVDWQPVAGATTGSNSIPTTGNGQFFRVK